MGEKASIVSLNKVDYEIFSSEINELHWKDFEKFVISVFKKIFKVSNVEIIHTQFSNDGGKDGEGILNIIQNSGETGFSIQIKIWIEVKKRTSSVKGNDVGFHVLSAFLNKVSLLIFASNSFFAPQVKDALSVLSNNHNINHNLIDGKKLFKLYQKTENIEDKLVATITQGEININFSYSKRPLKRYSQKSIDVEIKEPFYIFIDFDFKDYTGKIYDKCILDADNIQFIPYDTPSLKNAQQLNSKVTQIWIGYAENIISNLHITISKEKNSSVEFKLPINVQKPLFLFKTPPSISLKTNLLNNLLIEWLSLGKYNAAIIYGNAGTGKSYLINQYRYLWLQNNVSEIIIDGEIENSEAGLLNRFFQDAFPVPIGLLGEEQEETVYEFLVTYQLPPKSARILAGSICIKKEIDTKEFSADILSDLLYFLIRKKSEQRKIIIVYEDIHKCQPSVIQLLIKTHKRLIYEGIHNVFILLSSRKSASFKNQETLKNWILYVEEILEDQNIIPIILEPYSVNEAASIIKDTIFSISEVDTLKIIGQVGTTPFGLKEALFYIYQKKWIEYDSNINQFLLKASSFTRLRSAIKSNIFTQVTKSRILELKLIIPKWASNFIDAGACLGTSFNKEWCIEILKIGIDEDQINDFLSLSNKLGILKNSSIHSGYIKFDHDLIRASLLDDIGEIQFRDLSSELFKVIPDNPIYYKQKAFLAFQGSIPEAVEFYSESYGDKSAETEIYEDALEAYKMTLYVVDKNMMTGARMTNTSLWFSDDALNMAKESQVALELSIDTRYKKALSLCKKIVDTASHIGSGNQEIVRNFTSEGLILAKALNDTQSLGTFYIRQGIHLFDKKDIQESIDEFQKALEYLPLTDHYNRGHALVELAISQRHIGKKNESFKTLKQALKEVGNSSPEIKLRVLANAGGLYFNSDWKYTRRYWQRALNVAVKWGNIHYWVHMLIDIGHLDLLENYFDKAEEHYRIAAEKAHVSGLKGQEFRIYLHQSILVLMRSADDEPQLLYSETLLKQAEQLGIIYSIDRRLWRVYANWANVAELKAKLSSNTLKEKKQLLHLAYAYDKKNLNEFEDTIYGNDLKLIKNRRITPLLVNIYLRSLNQDYPNPNVLDMIDSDVYDYIKSIGELILNNNFENIPQNLIKFLKPLWGNHRFIFT